MIISIQSIFLFILVSDAINVSNRHGADVSSCGIQSNQPCKTIEYAVNQSVSSSSIQLTLDGGDINSQSQMYVLKRTLHVSNSFSIGKMENTSNPTIKLNAGYFIHANSTKKQLLNFRDIRFYLAGIVNVSSSDTKISLWHCSVHLAYVPVIYSSGKEQKLNLAIDSSTFDRCSGLTHLQTLKTGQISVSHSTFTTNHYAVNYFGFRIINATSYLRVVLTNTNFENITNPLDISAHNGNLPNVCQISMRECLFQSNKKPLNITSCSRVIIHQTKFYRNSHGALQVTDIAELIINNAEFVNNTDRSSLNIIRNNFVFLNASTFVNNYDRYQGGAIFAFDSRVVIYYSTFHQNYASLSGGSIYHAASTIQCCHLDLTNVTLVSASLQTSRTGTLIYSTQQMKLTNTLVTLTQDGSTTVDAYVDGMTSTFSIVVVKQGDFQFTCPTNTNPEVIKTKYISRSGIIVSPSGAAESIGCRRCPKQTYSLRSVAVKTDQFISEKAQCLVCPKGGNCSSDIISRDNFWGYQDKYALKFLPCPLSYCCSKDTIACESYQTCNDNREGILCGTCKASFTLSYFTNTCVASSSCNQTQFWSLYVVYALLIVLLLMYVEKVFVALKRLWMTLKKSHQSINSETLTQPLLYEQYQERNDVSTDQLNDDDSDLDQSDSIDNGCDKSSDFQRPPEVTFARDDNSNTKTLVVGFVKVIFFFYQTERLLRVNSSLQRDYGLLTDLKYLFTSLFNLHLESNRLSSLCPLVELDKTTKEVIKLMTMFLCLAFVAVLYLVSMSRHRNISRVIRCVTGERRAQLRARLKQCAVQLLLIGYANCTDFCLLMINCVIILDKKHLYHYGDVQCYTWWQTVIFVFICTWLVPFPLAIKCSVNMLRQNKISLRMFYTVLCVPWSFLGFYFFSKKEKDFIVSKTTLTEDEEEMNGIMKLFTGPFRDEKTEDETLAVPIVWDSVILSRRFVLSVVCYLIINPVIRLFVTFPILIAIFVVHIAFRPFKAPLLNKVEIASLFSLLLFNTANLFWAFSYMNNLSEMPGYFYLATVIAVIQDVILALPALCIVVAVFCFLVKKCCKCF